MNAGDRESAIEAVLADAKSAVSGGLRTDAGQAGYASMDRVPPVPESPAGPDFSVRVTGDDGRRRGPGSTRQLRSLRSCWHT